VTQDLLALVAPWGVGTVLTVAALFGFLPKFVVNLIVLVYPKKHPRRQELPAELDVVPLRERVTWVFGQCATVLFEGVAARIKDLHARQRGPIQPTVEHDEDKKENQQQKSEDQANDSEIQISSDENLTPEELRHRRFLSHAAQVTMGAAVFGPESGNWSARPSTAAAATTATNPRMFTTRVSSGPFTGAYVFEPANIRPLLEEIEKRRNNVDAVALAERLRAFYRC
jgi:hypothetical protein